MAAFTVIPAIDVLEGRCVRLSEGRREHVTIEGGEPAAAAARFVSEGAAWLHVVDLDGAFSGTPTPGLVETMVASAGGVPIQVGGGLRDVAEVEAALAAGAARAIVGTAALTETAGTGTACPCWPSGSPTAWSSPSTRGTARWSPTAGRASPT